MEIGKSKSYFFYNVIGYMDEDFKVIIEKIDDIVLYQYEFDVIVLKYIFNCFWDIVRDWFVIGCYLGLCVLDIKFFNKDVNFIVDFVVIVNEKIDIKVVVLINKQICVIMKKWSGLLFRMYEVEINWYIKKVCEIVKIDEFVLYFFIKGGEWCDFYLKKYEMVSCYIMCWFFIIELIRLGIVDNKIM